MNKEVPAISLAYALGILARKKWFIVLFTVAVAAFSFVYSALQEKEYPLISLLEVGQYQTMDELGLKEFFRVNVGDYTYVERAFETVSRYEAWAGVLAARKKFAPLEIRPEKDYKAQVKSRAVVESRLTVPRSDLAVAFMRELNHKVLADHKRLMAPLRTRMFSRSGISQSPGSGREKAARDGGKDNKKVQAADKEAGKNGRREVGTDSGVESANFLIYSRIIRPPEFGRRPVYPHPLRNSLLAGVVSLVLAVLCVFACRFFRELRAEKGVSQERSI